MLLFELMQENLAHASDSAVTDEENKDVAAIAKSLKVYYLVVFFIFLSYV